MLHQASCVAIGDPASAKALLIEGPPGSGKSSLALALIDCGAMLVGDDGVRLEARGERLWALPPPNITGLLEIRNVGLACFPVTSAPVALVIALSGDAPRLPDKAELVERAGCRLPLITLDPRMPVPELRAKHALLLHGIA